MDAQTKTMIQEALAAHLMARVPEAQLRAMYGGTVFELEQDVRQSQVGGVFAYTNHVSLEFSDGATFDDPHGVLEGKGKHRRHIKLRAVSEVEGKHCLFYLDQAIDRKTA